HRFGQRADVANEFASHASELEQTFHVALEEFTDDVVHVAARTKRATRSSDDDDANIALVAQRRKSVGQLAIDFKRQRVQALRTMQRDRRDALLVLFVKKRRGLFHAGINAIPSISTFAASSSSPATCTSTIAGKCLPMCLR